MNEKSLKLIALYICALIVSLPIYSASVFAGISNVKVVGTDNIDGFLRNIDSNGNSFEDTMAITLDADNGEDLTSDEMANLLRFDGSYPLMTSGIPFNSCVLSQGKTFSCQYSRTDFFDPETAKYNIVLFKSNGALSGEQYISPKFDNKAPTVTISANENKQKGEITIAYSAIDEKSSVNDCSGLQSVELLADSSFLLNGSTFEGKKCTMYQGTLVKLKSDFLDGMHTFQIKAIDRMGNQREISSNEITVDSTAPKIDDTSLTVSRNGKNFSYVDSASIDNVKFTFKIESEDLKEVYGDLTSLTKNDPKSKNMPAVCDQEDIIWTCSFTITLKADPTVSPEILVTAKDEADNKATAVLFPSLEYDTEPPIIEGFSLLSENNEVTFVNDNMLDFVFRVNVTAIDIDQASIKADVSAIFPNVIGFRPPSKLFRNPGTNTYTAEWILNNLEFTGPATLTIVVQAKDRMGNVAEQMFSKTFEYDNEGPIVSSITTNYNINGMYYVGKNTTITAVITDNGIGTNQTLIFMDLSSLGLGSINPSECISDICYWYNIQSNLQDGQPATIRIDTITSDLLGNLLKDPISIDVISDISDPVIHGMAYDLLYPTNVDTLTFSINASDSVSGIVKVEIDASAISFEGYPKEATCSSEGQIQICSVEVGTLSPVHVKGQVKAIVYDGAGNVGEKSIEAEIFELDVTSTPNFFTNRVVVTPARIDRRLASKIPITLFMHVLLSSPSGGNILSKTVSCDTLSGAHFVNEFEDDPIITGKTSTSIAEIAEDTTDIKCKLTLKLQQGPKVYENPEIEEIVGTVQLFNVPLGTIGDAAQDEIDFISGWITELESRIDNLQQVHDILGTICNIAQIFGTIDAVIQAIITVINGVLCAFSWVPGTDAAWRGICFLNGFHTFVKNFVWDPGTLPTGVGLGYAIKWMCMFYTCRLADPAFWAQAAINVGASLARGAVQRSRDRQITTPGGNGNEPDIEWKQNPDGTYTSSQGTGTYDPSTGMIRANDGTLYHNDRYQYNGVAVIPPQEGGTAAVGAGIPQVATVPGAADIPNKDNPISIEQFNDLKERTLNAIRDNSNFDQTAFDNQWNQYEQDWSASGAITSQLQTETAPPATVLSPSTPQPSPSQVTDKKGNTWVRSGNNYVMINTQTGAQTVGTFNPRTNTITVPPASGTGPSQSIRLRSGWGESIVRSNSDWARAMQRTQLGAPLAPDTWQYDPYRSIHYANAWYCIPGILYNYKKDRQIQCLYRNCLTAHAQKGLPYQSCQVAYKERLCVYIDSAQYKFHGNQRDIWGRIVDSLFGSWVAAYFTVIGTACAIWSNNALTECTKPACGASFFDRACALTSVAQSLLSIYDTFSNGFDFSGVNADLQNSPDFCATT